VLAQRYVDSWRAQRRTEPLPDDDSARANVARPAADPDRETLLAQVERSLRVAIDRLPPKDRLRLRSYYVSQLTLAEIGRLIGEHEATVSRHLARTRRELREAMQRYLRDDAALSETQVARALELALEDPGELNLQQLLAERKSPPPDRSR
jgi:DNA-directed RNA polymerase specialized sigma24 family protein